MSKYVIAIGVSIFFFVNVMAQQSIADLTKKFDAYQANTDQSTVHLIFNQTKFCPGDTVWFKAYLLDKNFRKFEGKQLLNIDLVDSNGESKLHFMFALNSGVGYNQFVIPNALSAGIYLITVYSDAFGETVHEILFKKQIIVVRNNEVIVKSKLVNVGVEGGSLVDGVSSKIVFHTDRGKLSIQLIDSNEQIISQTITDDNGFTSFNLTPRQGLSYYLQIVGDSIRTPIPELKDAYVLHIPLIKSNNESVKIVATATRDSRLRFEEITVVVSNESSIVYTSTFTQGINDAIELDVPQENLRTGILNVSLLDRMGIVLATRDFYIPEDNHVGATIEIQKRQFQVREKVSFEFSLFDSLGNPVEGEFVVRAINQSVINEINQNSFQEELNVISRFDNGFEIHRSDSDWIESLDNYLIVFPVSVPWRNIIKGKDKISKVNFTNVITKRGTAFFADTGKPLLANTQLMFYLQQSKARYQTLTTKDGKFGVAMLEVFGIDELLYFAKKDGEEIRNVKIEWENKHIEFPQSLDSSEGANPDGYASFVMKKKLISESFDSFTSLTSSNVKRKLEEFEDFDADVSINIEDYIPFGTMEELIKEVIPAMYYRQSGQNKIVRVSLSEPMKIESDPLYIIDGIATKNTAFFLSLKPSNLNSIKIMRSSQKLLPLGLMGKNGIVSVSTKQGDIREQPDSSKLIMGLNDPVSFRVNDYSNKNDLHRPNFRSTIYWNPSVKTDEYGKAKVDFICTDDLGKVEIRVDGLTTKGQPFTAHVDIEVSPVKK